MKDSQHNQNSKASLLAKWRNRTNKADSFSIKRIPENTAIPLSHEQKRLWFLQQLHPNNPFYNYSELYHISGGDLVVDLFEESIRCIEQKHDGLRSSFKIENGVPTVKVANDSVSKFNFYDFSDKDTDIAENQIYEIIRSHSRNVFNLSEYPLFNSTLIKRGERDYLFLVVFHHIITDKWSMRVFREELASNYKSLVNGQIPQILKPEIQYGSYAFWQQGKTQNKEHLNYWIEKLSGKIPKLNLPTDFSKKAQPTYSGTFNKQVYSETTSNAFFNLCKTLDATPYTVMLSVYYLLLQKYSGQTDILIGTPITKRDHKSLENLIGFFNDTLVLRTNIDNSLNFSELVKAVKKTTLDAFSNKDIAFDTLVKELKPTRSLNINPFFQVMFLYHEVPETPSFGKDITIAYEPYDQGVAKFDLTLYISNDKGALTSLLEYETDLFEASTIERMHLHFKILLNNIIKSPTSFLSDIEMKTPEELNYYQKQGLYEYASVADSATGIHHIIEQQALLHPGKIALQYKDTFITYKQLNEKAKKIALSLKKNDVKPNDIVGLCIERSHKMIIGLLGILKAGAAYLPLDPNYPEERINYILENTASKLLVTEEGLSSSFNNPNIQVQTIESLLEDIVDSNVELPHVKGSDIAYVIFTSGSTGKPKGVPVSHKSITNSTISRDHFYEKNPEAFLLMSSVSFDSSKVGIFWTLCFGGTLIISEEHLEQDIDKMTALIKSSKVSHTLMLPSLYANLLEYGDTSKLSQLDTIIVAGESCPSRLVKKHFETLPAAKLYNEYGPTEATVWCIAHKIQETDSRLRSVPIGVPTANAEVFILNENLEKIPFGSTGELYIGGIGLTKGYINHLEGAFISHPFNDDSNVKLYKTGDLARFRGDGSIEFLGRKDTQIKIRGYRIELDEIEQVVLTQDNIEQAAISIESNQSSLKISDIEKASTEEIARFMEENLKQEEIKELINSIEGLEKEELNVMIKNIEE